MPRDHYTFVSWFHVNWSRVALPAALLLLALGPFLVRGMPFALALVTLQLPVYMLHQYEEHAHGAFKAFINRLMGGGREVLGDWAIFWINIVGVWVLDLVVLYLAAYVNASLGLIAIYLTLVNAVLHIVMAIVLRRYNPGLWTSIVLFVPAGGYALVVLARASHATLAAHAIGLGVALLVHLLIVAYIRLQLTRKPASPAI